MTRLTPLAALTCLIMLGGCSLTLPVSGTSDTANEVFTGTATGYVTGSGTLQVMANSGVSCTGSFGYVERRRLGKGAVKCSDGRQGDLVFNSEGKAGYGYALMNNGSLAQFLFGEQPAYTASAWNVVYARYQDLSAMMGGTAGYCADYPDTPKCSGQEPRPQSALQAGPPSAAPSLDAAAATPFKSLLGQSAANPAPAAAARADLAPATSAQGMPGRTAAPVLARDALADLHYPAADPRADDVAVIIGNSAYRGADIPPVPPARADATAMLHYAVEGLGIRPGNVIELKDATAAQLAEVFGNARDPRGKLFNWVKPDRSRVFVYYAGHGAPSGPGGTPVLVPVDASAAQIALSGYPLDTLYANLAKLPAESVTVVLEACFSGTSAAGSLVPAASPVGIVPRQADVPRRLTVITAAAADQIASWEPDRSHGLFTEFFLKGMAGAADQPPSGNGDGKVSFDELRSYLDDNVGYSARRYFGRDQTVSFTVPGRY